jgi:hypothetical protein
MRECGTIPQFPPAIFMAWCLTGSHQEKIKDLARNQKGKNVRGKRRHGPTESYTAMSLQI